MCDIHSDSNNNMVNLYNSRLKESNIDEIIDDSRKKLAQWRDECRKTIDEIYQKKLQELDYYINGVKTNYEMKKEKVQTKISELYEQQNMNEKNIDLLGTIIKSIEKDLHDIEQTSIEINSRPLLIDDNYVHIEKAFSLNNLSPDYLKFFYSQESSPAIASNDRYLLMHQYPYLCLIDRDSKIVKQYFWNYDWIRDICWSSVLYVFVLITTTNIYVMDENLLNCTPLRQDIQQVWFSCTCSDKSLYLSTCEWGSSVYELSLIPPFDVVNHWKSPTTCEIHEGITDIQYNNQNLALMVTDSKEHKKRLELKLAQSFDTIWSRPLSIGPNIRLVSCCPLNHNEWLVIDGTNLNLYHVTKDGEFHGNIRYNSVPYRANLFGSNLLAISSEGALNLHKIS